MPNPNCDVCSGTGSYAEHHPSCDGTCKLCPVEVQCRCDDWDPLDDMPDPASEVDDW